MPSAHSSRWDRAAKFHHPNVIKVYESGRCQLAGMDLLYVVTEFAQENLAEFLPQRALAPEEAHDMLEPFIDALWYLHGQGFAHGRIKPANILAIDDQLKLSSDSICPDGDMQIGAGKPDIYVAPETNGRTTTAGDVWSLGAAIVESLTQHRPAETSGDPTFPDSLPQPYLDIARNTLRRDPKTRWTITEISKRFNPNAAPHPTTAAITEPAPPSAKTANIAPPASTAPKPAPSAGPAAVAIAEPPKPTPSKSAGMTAAAASASAATGAAVAVAPAPAPAAASVEPKAIRSRQTNKEHRSSFRPALKRGAAFRRRQEFQQRLVHRHPSSPRGRRRCVVYTFRSSANSCRTSSRRRSRPLLLRQPKPSAPASQPAAEPTPPSSNSKPDTTPATTKPSTPAPARNHGGIDGPPQVSSNQPPASATPTSTPASERTPVKSNAAAAPTNSAALSTAAVSTPLPATSRTAAIASTSLPAGSVTQGAPLNQTMPEISSRARSTIHGTVRVVVKVRVDKSGAVSSAVPASSPSRFFSDAAVQAAKRWDFTPAKISGQPVPSEWLVRFDFTSTDTKVLPSQTKP